MFPLGKKPMKMIPIWDYHWDNPNSPPPHWSWCVITCCLQCEIWCAVVSSALLGFVLLVKILWDLVVSIVYHEGLIWRWLLLGVWITNYTTIYFIFPIAYYTLVWYCWITKHNNIFEIFDSTINHNMTILRVYR